MDTVTTPIANSIPATCARLGLGRSHLYAEISAGRIKTIKAGRRTLVLETELQRYAASLAEQSQKAAA